MAVTYQSVPLRRKLLRRETLLGGTAIVFYIALADFVVHMMIAGNYGYFRDELYYIVAGQRLAFGYVDFPPVIAVIASLLNLVAGDSLVSIHVVPAIAGAAVVFLAGMITKEFGGGVRAQVLAAVAAMFSASFAVSSIFSMDVLDMLWWTVIAYVLVKILKQDNKKKPGLWVAVGVIAGIGLMTKLTIAFYLLSIVVALALTPKRGYLRSRWFWTAGLIAFVIVLPYILWNAANDWATVDFFVHHGGLNGGGPLSFLTNQVLIAGLLGLPLAAVGLLFYFRSGDGRPYSILGLSFVILLILFTLMNAKPYFIMGAYPFVFAGGSVLVEKYSRRRRFVLPGYLAGIFVIGLLLAPLYAPVLPPQTFVTYYGGLTGAASGAEAQQTAGAFPQYLGDRFGWNTMTQDVANAFRNLSASEQSQACILTLNYGEASALTFLGKAYDLPPVISGHNNYYIWGPGRCTGSVLITVGYYPSDLRGYFNSVVVIGNITCSYCMASEDNLPIIVATGLNAPIQSAWPLLKHYD